jgi:hypothetical protein
MNRAFKEPGADVLDRRSGRGLPCRVVLAFVIGAMPMPVSAASDSPSGMERFSAFPPDASGEIFDRTSGCAGRLRRFQRNS